MVECLKSSVTDENSADGALNDTIVILSMQMRDVEGIALSN